MIFGLYDCQLRAGKKTCLCMHVRDYRSVISRYLLLLIVSPERAPDNHSSGCMGVTSRYISLVCYQDDNSSF